MVLSDDGGGLGGQLLRPRLVEALASRFRVRLVLIAAGAGFGKTVAIRHAIHENRLTQLGRDIWIPVRECGARSDLILNRLARELDLHADPTLDEVAERVLALAPEAVCICLDDVHLFDDFALVVGLLERLPANGHLCLASRFEPPLRLSRLAAAGELVQVSEEVLAFTADELTDLAAMVGTEASSFAASGGWAARAVLLAKGGTSLADRFVREEVLDELSAGQVRDLSAWVAIGRMNRSLMSSVFEELTWDAAIKDVPLVDTDASGAKLHDLWRGTLGFARTDLELRAVLARAASELAATDPSRAIELWREAEAWPELLAFYRDCTLGFRDPPGHAQLAATLDAMPTQVGADPAFLMAKAQCALQDDPASAYRLLDAAAQAFAERTDVHGEMAALLNRGDLAQAQRFRADLRIVCDRAAELASSGDPWCADVLDILLVMEHRTAHRAQEGLDLLAIVEARSTDRSVLEMVPWLRASLNLLIGRPNEAKAAAVAALESRSETVRALAVASLGWALWLEGDQHGTLELLTMSSELVDDRGDPSWIVAANAYFAWALLMVGRTVDGEHMLSTAKEYESQSTVRDGAVVCVHALAQVCAGDEDAAAAILRDTGRAINDMGDMMRRTAALWTVLRPDLDELLERFEGCHATAHRLGLAVRSTRTGDARAIAELDLPTPSVVASMLPPRWSAELAVGLADVGRTREAVALVEGREAPWEALLELHRTTPSPASGEIVARLPARPRCVWRVEVLGPPRLFKNGEEYEDEHWRRGRVRELLMYLVESGAVSRERVMAALWPQLDERKARRNLEVTLSYLVALLDGDRSANESTYFVRIEDDRLSIQCGDHLTVDVHEFEQAVAAGAAREAQAAPTAALADYATATSLYRGPYLELKGQPEWTEDPRRRCAVEFASIASRAAELLTALDRATEAIDLAERAVAADPWATRAHAARLAAHMRVGNTAAARACVELYRRLIDDLGVERPAELVGIEAELGSSRAR